MDGAQKTPDMRVRHLEGSPQRGRQSPFFEPPDTPDSPSSMYQVRYRDYESAIEAIAQLELELAEFQQSSHELEKELEKELSALEEDNDVLKRANQQLNLEIQQLQRARIDAEQDSQRAKEDLYKRVKVLEAELHKKAEKLVDIEILNDNIEQSERNLNSSYRELQEQYHAAQERIVILESESSDMGDLLLKEKLNHQNTQNELEELRRKLDQLLKKEKENKPAITKSNSIRQLHTMIEHTKGMESKIDNIRISLNKNQNLKINRIKSGTTTKLSNTTITTTSSMTTPSKPRRMIPLSPSSFKLSSLAREKFSSLDAIEGSPNIKDAEKTHDFGEPLSNPR